VGGDATVAGLLTVGALYASVGDLTVGGLLTAGAYSNLPLAPADGSAPGVVVLSSSSNFAAAAASNTAASTAVVAALHAVEDARADELQNLYSDAMYSMYLASNMGASASNIANALTYARAYDAPAVVNGLVLTNLSQASNAGVRLLLGAGTGPTPDDLWRSLNCNPAFVADAYGSNCASLTVTYGDAQGAELVIAGASFPTTTAAGDVLMVGTPCVLGVGQRVSVRAGDDVRLFPGDMAAPSATQDGGVTFSVEASSVFASQYDWCQPYQGVSFSPTNTAWISAAGTYDTTSGYPTGAAALTALGDGTSVRGEWLQVDCDVGLFASRVLLAVDNPNYVPDDFVLLGLASQPLQQAQQQQPAWQILTSPTDTSVQGVGLVQAGATGRYFDVLPALQQTRFAAVRLVVTRVALAPAYAAFANLAQVDVFKVRGSVYAPPPDTLFSVDVASLVVDSGGHVGIGNAAPSAPLHFGGLLTEAISADARGTPAVVVLDNAAAGASSDDAPFAYRGWALSSNALVHRVETSNADHAFAAGQAELMRLRGVGRLGILTSDPACELDVAGDVNVQRSLTVASNALLSAGAATFLGGHMAATAAGGATRGTVAACLPRGRAPAVGYIKLATVQASAGPATFRVSGAVSRGTDSQTFQATLTV
jgi:hypothetical protein